MAVVADLVIIAVLFALALAVTYERPRVWLVTGLSALATRYGRPERPAAWEQEHTELWLMARQRQLSEDLRRIEQLIRRDETMSATRQLGNRLARDQLIASLARIPDLLPGRDRFVVDEPAAPPVFTSPARARSVEVLDVTGWR